MVKVSILRDACNAMVNAERRGKRQVILRPSSKILIKFLELMQKNGYIGEFELVDDHRAGKVVVNLTGRLNKAVVISPRYSISQAKIEKTATELLPSRQFGHMILTTPYGMMDHHEALRRHTGGKIVGCFY